MKHTWFLMMATAGLLILTSGPTAATLQSADSENRQSGCAGGYLVRSAGSPGSPSELLKVDPVSGSTTSITQLPMHLNALGAHDGTLYAIGRPDPATLAPGEPLTAYGVQLAHDGSVTLIGAIAGAPPGGFRDAYAGTIFAGNWYLLHHDDLFTINMAANGPLRVTGQVTLSDRVGIGDWAADNDGLLTISTLPGQRAALTRVDPVTGAVAILAEPQDLPGGSVYGAVWRAGTDLFALHNGTATVYRIGLRAPYPVRPVLTGIEVASADAAWCTAPPEPPGGSPSAAPEPSRPEPSRPEPSQPAARQAAADSPTPVPAPPRSVPSPSSARPTAAPSALPPPLPPPLEPPPALPAELQLAPAAAAPARHTVEQHQRRWSAAAAAVLVMGGLIGVRALGRRG